jgi:hypothetical protein
VTGRAEDRRDHRVRTVPGDGVDRGRDRWGQVQADQVANLPDQIRIGRDLELVLSPGLEPEDTPDLTDGLFRTSSNYEIPIPGRLVDGST